MVDVRKRLTPIDIKVGQRIRMARLEKGLAQEDVAEALGVTFQQVQKYEKGVNRVSVGRLAQIAAAIGIDVMTLLDDATSAASSSGIAGESLSLMQKSTTIRMLRLFLRLDTTQQRKVIDLLESMQRNRDSAPL